MLQSLLEQDERLTHKLRVAEKPGALRRLAILLAHSGDLWLWLVVLALLAWLGDEYWSQRAILYIIGILITAVLVFAIKFTVRRRRPEANGGKYTEKPTRIHSLQATPPAGAAGGPGNRPWPGLAGAGAGGLGPAGDAGPGGDGRAFSFRCPGGSLAGAPGGPGCLILYPISCSDLLKPVMASTGVGSTP